MHRKRLFALFALFAPFAWGAAQAQSGPLARAIEARLGTDRFSVQSLSLPGQAGAPFEVLLELDGQPAALALDPHSVRSGEYRVLATGAGDTVREVEPAPLATYRGALHRLGGNPLGDGLVAASLEPAGLTALLLLDDGRQLVIEPAATFSPEAAARRHVIYDVADARASIGGCAAAGLSVPVGLGEEDPPETSAGTGLRLCEIALEADTYYYDWKGSSVPATQAAVESLINSVALIYETYAGISYQITTLVIQTDTTDNDHYGSNKHDKLLNQFVSYWRNHFGNVHRDTAHLLTGRTMAGNVAGFAYIGVVCDTNDAFGWSWANAPVPVAQRIAISAHELGHNFNAQHCNGDGDCAVMCATIGSCSGLVDRFGSRSQTKISGWRNSVGCLSKVPPTIELPFAELFHRLKRKIWPTRDGVARTAKAVGEPSGKRSANLDKSSDQLGSYKIDLSAASDPVLSYFAEHRGVEAGEELIIEYQNAAAVWTELARITSDGTTQNTFRYHEHALPPAALWDSCRIRFQTNGDQGNDDWFIDDVRVESTTPPVSAALCASDTPPVVAYHVLLGGAPATQQIQVRNCGAPGTSLGWVASESPPRTWLALAPTSGTVLSGEPFDVIDVSFDPTGLTAGVYTTMVKVQNSGVPSQYIEVPVTLVVHAGTLFTPGDLLQGEIDPVGESDLAAFCGVAGQKLKLEVWVSSGDLQPVISAVDESGTAFATLNFNNSSTPRKGRFKLTESGLFGILVTGAPGTSGSYNIQTRLKNPADAKLWVGKRKPATEGGDVTLEVGALPGTMFSATIVPKRDGDGPFTLSVTDPTGRPIHTSLFSRPLLTGGTQLLQLPLGPMGLYTLAVSGFSAREKVFVTLDPQAPPSTGSTINLP